MGDGESTQQRIRAFDLFCGAGGSSWGAKQAGVEVRGGLDRELLAVRTFQDNFPEARTYCGNAEDLDPTSIAEEVGPIDLLLASPSCTDHTPAKGSVQRSEESRATAFQVARYAAALKPRWIVVENVIHMRQWERYDAFLADLRAHHSVATFTLNAADFGVPQTRRRLFVLCDREADAPQGVRPAVPIVRKIARDITDLDGEYRWSPLHHPRRAPATLDRATRAFEAIGNQAPFLIVYYGTDKAGGWQSLEVPLRTVTTLDRFAIVRRMDGQYVMRMLQVAELRHAMGFTSDFALNHGNRRDKIRMLGNSVCPPVMQSIVKVLCRTWEGA